MKHTIWELPQLPPNPIPGDLPRPGRWTGICGDGERAIAPNGFRCWEAWAGKGFWLRERVARSGEGFLAAMAKGLRCWGGGNLK